MIAIFILDTKAYDAGSYLNESFKSYLKVVTARKVSKYGVFSGPHFPVFGLSRILSISPYSSRMRENTYQKNSVFGYFSRSEYERPVLVKLCFDNGCQLCTFKIIKQFFVCFQVIYFSIIVLENVNQSQYAYIEKVKGDLRHLSILMIRGKNLSRYAVVILQRVSCNSVIICQYQLILQKKYCTNSI